MNAQVYTDPGAPGAPQVGDVVVAMWPVSWSREQRVGRLERSPAHPAGFPWRVRCFPGHTYPYLPPRVRRPTPEELAVYQLTQGDL